MDYNWCFVSVSHSDINTANRLCRLPPSTCSVFIISVILKSQILFSCAVCLSARSGYRVQIIFPCFHIRTILEMMIHMCLFCNLCSCHCELTILNLKFQISPAKIRLRFEFKFKLLIFPPMKILAHS